MVTGKYVSGSTTTGKRGTINLPKYVEKDISNLYELMIAITR